MNGDIETNQYIRGSAEDILRCQRILDDISDNILDIAEETVSSDKITQAKDSLRQILNDPQGSCYGLQETARSLYEDLQDLERKIDLSSYDRMRIHTESENVQAAFIIAAAILLAGFLR